jgi:predicted tellurium resistance membrane protein TerC
LRWATPLSLALMLVGFMERMFAVVSVPTIFAITNDLFIVYTSNIFANLGLQALYGVLMENSWWFRVGGEKQPMSEPGYEKVLEDGCA